MPGCEHRLPLYLRALVSAERCILCHEGATQGRDIVCPACEEKLERESSWICPKCGAKIRDCICMTEEMEEAGVSAYVKLFPYLSDGSLTSDRLLYRLKLKKDRMLASRECACLSVNLHFALRALKIKPEDCLVTYIPRTRKRVIESGTDQGFELCRAMAKILNCDRAPLISRVPGTVVQKTLDAAERLQNAEDAFDVKNADLLCGRCVIIIDDLVTSGATMSGCASLLLKAGASHVFCASLSHTVGRTAPYFSPDGESEPFS